MRSEPLYSADLRPHRSLGRRGIRNVIIFTAVMAAIPGIFFYSIGAWPVIGLLGLDIIALTWALTASFRSGHMFERVTLWRDRLEVQHVTANGRERLHTFNPFWVKLDVARDFEDRVTRIALKSRKARLEVGTFLTPDDKKLFATSFSQALTKARA